MIVRSALPAIFDRRDFLLGTSGTLFLGLLANLHPHFEDLRASNDLTFLVVGDWGRDGKTFQPHVANQMAITAKLMNARFTVSTGDNFYWRGVSSEFDSQWRTSFEDIYSDPALQHPWFPVLGNHDYGGNVDAQLRRSKHAPRWQMRDRWFELTKEDHHHPDLHLFLIDTVLWRGKEDFGFNFLGSRIRAEDAEEQRRWLEEKLGKSTAKHKLVFGHHPIYSVGPHGGLPPGEKMAELDALLRSHDVTAYINGHDHCLYAIEHQGMHYLCSGGGSEEWNRFSGHPTTSGCVIRKSCEAGGPTWLSYVDRAGFAAIQISPDAVRFSFIDRAGLVSPMRILDRANRRVAV